MASRRCSRRRPCPSADSASSGAVAHHRPLVDRARRRDPNRPLRLHHRPEPLLRSDRRAGGLADANRGRRQHRLGQLARRERGNPSRDDARARTPTSRRARSCAGRSPTTWSSAGCRPRCCATTAKTRAGSQDPREFKGFSASTSRRCASQNSIGASTSRDSSPARVDRRPTWPSRFNFAFSRTRRLAVGSIGLVELVPLVFFGLYGGVLADRLNRRRLIISMEMISCSRRRLCSSTPCSLTR